MDIRFVRPDDSWWDECFNRLPTDRRDIFYTSAFARLCQCTLNRRDEVMCAAALTDSGAILYVFALRDLGVVTGRPEAGEIFDMTGLYGRGGVVCDDGSVASMAAFHAAIAAFAAERRVVCAFDRYHPVFANEQWAAAETRIMDVGGFVALDLSPAIEDIEASYKHNVRKAIRKAEAAGVEAFIDKTGAYLDEFLDIYHDTMHRNEARDFYYFDRAFFESLHALVPGGYFYVHATLGGRIVSTELVLTCSGFSHSFLGGTYADAMTHAPNNLLKRAIVRHAKAQGGHAFLLGGGARPDDGIFAYKRAFAPNGVLPSRIGGHVFDCGEFGTLRARLEAAGVPIAPGRFQFYDPD